MIEMRREEVDVFTADVDGGLRNRASVAEVTRTDRDETVLRKNQIAFSNARRLGNEVVIPSATCLLIQRCYKR